MVFFITNHYQAVREQRTVAPPGYTPQVPSEPFRTQDVFGATLLSCPKPGWNGDPPFASLHPSLRAHGKWNENGAIFWMEFRRFFRWNVRGVTGLGSSQTSSGQSNSGSTLHAIARPPRPALTLWCPCLATAGHSWVSNFPAEWLPTWPPADAEGGNSSPTNTMIDFTKGTVPVYVMCSCPCSARDCGWRKESWI